MHNTFIAPLRCQSSRNLRPQWQFRMMRESAIFQDQGGVMFSLDQFNNRWRCYPDISFFGWAGRTGAPATRLSHVTKIKKIKCNLIFCLDSALILLVVFNSIYINNNNVAADTIMQLIKGMIMSEVDSWKLISANHIFKWVHILNYVHDYVGQCNTWNASYCEYLKWLIIEYWMWNAY